MRGRRDDGILPNVERIVPSGAALENISFQDTCVIKKLNNLKLSCSPGPDKIPAVLLIKLKNQLASPLAIMFNLIFKSGNLPDEWKIGIVKPLFKKGSSSDASNYRPISLTCIICKIFESIVKDHILSFLSKFNCISRDQHGFLKGHSTITNLLECFNDWSTSLDQKAGVGVLYMDFAKAFDVVSIPKLLLKLEKFGIGGLVLSCITSFLTGRSQRVKLGSVFSESLHLVSGVPQGSVLGPFLFILYINDLPNVVDVDLQSKLFADDLKLYNKPAYCPDKTRT